MAVADQNGSKPVPGERRAVIHNQIANRPRACQERPRFIERRGSERNGRTEQHGPAGLFRDNPLRQSLAEKLGAEQVRPHRQVRPVLFERADGENDGGALAVELAETRVT